MDCTTGCSRGPIGFPAASKFPEGGFLGIIVIDHGIGSDIFELSVE